MQFIAAMVSYLVSLLHALVDSLRALLSLLKQLSELIARQLGRGERPHYLKGRDPANCTPIQRPEFNRPDPLIYSQTYLMSLGFAVTWDNPDITLERSVGPLQSNEPPDPARTVSSWMLEPDAEYDVVARVWNGSTEAPVIGLPVRFSVHSFGVGAKVTSLGTATTNLGVKGGPGCPAYVRVRWRTPRTAGHYCIQALLDWFDDLNPANNLGQENTLVGKASSPATIQFTLGNWTASRRTFRFEVDTYTLPTPSACNVREREAERGRREWQRQQQSDRRTPVVAGRPETFIRPDVPEVHRRESHPLPAGWSLILSPERPVLEAEGEMQIKADITPPAGFRGLQPININAFDDSGFVGGITLYVEKE